MGNRVIMTLVSAILILTLVLTPIMASPGAVDAAPSGRYRLSWADATVRGWYNPLGTGTQLVTSTNYDFDSEWYKGYHGMRHAGVDFVASGGVSTVHAIADGTVVYVGASGGYNEHVFIRHPSQQGLFLVVYGHIARSAGISAGVSVTRGQVIGIVRAGGDPDHLHFGVNINEDREAFDYDPHNFGQTAVGTNPEDVGWRDPTYYLGCLERAKKILIDPGHGLFYHIGDGEWKFQRDEFDGYREDLGVVDIAIHLRSLLQTAGYIVYTTRELNKGAGIGESGEPKWHEGAYAYLLNEMRTLTGNPSYEPRSDAPAEYSIGQRKDLNIRPEYSNQIRPDYFISIHTNGGALTGTMTFWGTRLDARQLADRVHDNLLMMLWNEDRGGVHDRHVRQEPGYIVIGRNNHPSIIVEAAYHDNPNDRAKLKDPAFLEKIARGIYYGVINPMDRGIAWLRCKQNQSSGAWSNDPALTSFAVLTMLNWGYDESDKIVSKGIDYILSRVNANGSVHNQSSRYTYYTSIAILPLAATGNADYHDEIGRMRNWLIGSQWSEDEDSFYGSVGPAHSYYGGFGYGSGSRPDLSNTQWALMGLKAADRALGLQATATYAKAADYFLTRCQNPDGGSGYTPGSSSILTMTAASVWSYKLCGRASNDANVLGGIHWLTNRYSLVNSDGWGYWSEYYYNVTFAKALTMTHRVMLGEHDWFKDLAQKLYAEQHHAGNWPNTGMMGSEMSAAWAIMALQTRMLPPSGDFGLWATLESHCDLHMYDSLGRHTGVNYITGMVEENIPGSSFKILDPDGNEVPYSGGTPDEGYKQVLEISGVMPGSYRIELVGTSDGPFHLTVGGLSDGVEVHTHTYAGNITEGARLAAYITVAWMEGFTVLHDPLTALPVLGVHPSHIDAVGSPNTVVQVAFAISEVSGGAKMHSVRAYCTGILGTQGSISGDDVVFDMNDFDVEPGGSQIVNASIPIPADFVGPGLGSIIFESADGGTRQVTLTVLTTITAIVDFDPNTLNLRGRGGGVVTVYIELPEGYDVGQIDVSSIRLNDTASALEWPYEVGDYNDNGVPDLMVKFDRRAVHEVMDVGEAVEITITGEVDGIPFMGVDTIRVIG